MNGFLLTRARPILADMPWHIKQKILMNADFASRMSLAASSRQFFELSDELPLHLECVTVTAHDGNRAEIAVRLRAGDEEAKKTGTFEEIAEQFLRLVQREKTTIRMLTFEDETTELLPSLKWALAVMQALLGLGDRRPHVEELTIAIDAQDTTLDFPWAVLQYLQPETLETINLEPKGRRTEPLDVSRLASMEQWKRAKSLGSSLLVRLSPEHMSHFEWMILFECHYEVEDVAQLFETLKEAGTARTIQLFSETACSAEDVWMHVGVVPNREEQLAEDLFFQHFRGSIAFYAQKDRHAYTFDDNNEDEEEEEEEPMEQD